MNYSTFLHFYLFILVNLKCAKIRFISIACTPHSAGSIPSPKQYNDLIHIAIQLPSMSIMPEPPHVQSSTTPAPQLKQSNSFGQFQFGEAANNNGRSMNYDWSYNLFNLKY